MIANAFNPSTCKAEAGGSLKFKANMAYIETSYLKFFLIFYFACKDTGGPEAWTTRENMNCPTTGSQKSCPVFLLVTDVFHPYNNLQKPILLKGKLL